MIKLTQLQHVFDPVFFSSLKHDSGSVVLSLAIEETDSKQ